MQSDVNKRRAERRKQIRRRRIKVAFIFFLIISLITLVIMCFTVFFPIKRINVSGSEIYDKRQIIKASGLTTEDNLFVVSEDKIEDKIRRKLPYIDNVSLKRVLPDAVVLTVVDAKEYAYYMADNKYYIISDSGYVLKEQTEEPENVFQIVSSGIKGNVGEAVAYENSAEMQLAQKLIETLGKKDINIDKIDISNILNITLEIEGRFTVILGNSDYTDEKVSHLASMIDSIGERSGKINLAMWTPENSQGSFVENKS